MRKLLFAAFLTIITMNAPTPAAEKRPMTVEDLFLFQRVADPQISPDGKTVAYQVTEVDFEANKSRTHIWLAATDGETPPRQVTSSGKKDAHPRWSPEGTRLLFESNRSGTSQLYILDLAAGGEARKVTEISTGAGTGIWSPDGSHIAFVSTVHPEFSELPFAESDKKNKEKNDAIEKNPVKAKTFTKLFYRHWDEYVGDKRQHLFVKQMGYRSIDSPAFLAPDWSKCLPLDVTPGDRDANPTSTTFSVGDDFTFTPDSSHLVFTAVPASGESWSTNHDLCRVRITNNDQGPQSGRKSTDWEALTSSNKGADNSPRFSPDGKKLAWRSQAKAGYEADKWDIQVVDANPDGTFAGKPENRTASKDVSIAEFAWGSNHTVNFVADDAGANSLFSANASGKIKAGIAFDGKMWGGVAARQGQISGLTASRDGRVWMYSLAKMSTPAHLHGVRFSENKIESIQPLGHNNDLLATLDLPRPESVKVKIEDGEMQMWLLKPPGFDAKKKWPVVYLIHGGPQGAWEDAWSFRWNAQVWAAQGYVIAMPNPRGSTGFGQKFVDQISSDWGGKCYRDLVAGLDFVEKLPYVDKDRIGSAGGSFGGYMQNWFAVNDISKRLKCLITHCSVYNFESMWGTTEELWFDEYEHGGLPWEIPGKYREFSPHTRAGEMGKHKTPMLIIHNDLDFRCPIGQGHELFTALQRQGVPSRFVNFPDEGHWVLKPKNSQLWHKEVFGWLTKYVPPGGK